MRVIAALRGAAVAFALIVAAAEAQTISLPFTAQARFAGVVVAFPVQATLVQAAAGQPVGVVAKVDLEDCKSKFDAVIRAAGLHQPPGNYQSFDYKGTLLAVDGSRLRAKYHFKIDVKHLPATNGSVELFFTPVVEANALRFVGENPKLNISNDLVRGVVRAMDLDGKIAKDGLAAVNGFLASPEARLQLPKEVAAMHPTLASARFGTENGRMLLVVDGKLSPAAGTPSPSSPGSMNRP